MDPDDENQNLEKYTCWTCFSAVFEGQAYRVNKKVYFYNFFKIIRNFVLKLVFNNIKNAFKSNANIARKTFLSQLESLSQINGFAMIIAIKSMKIIFSQNGRLIIMKS